MPEITVPLRLPELGEGVWLQGPEVTMAFAKGSVVLIDFWEATCIHCLRTLPYLAAWHRRYGERGLVIVGVHTPEFEASADPDIVRRAIDEHEIPYPVLLDPDRATWQVFANHYWPAKYLADHRGYLRWEHVGEGAYAEAERWIQKLLREAGDEAPMPEVLDPLRPEDALIGTGGASDDGAASGAVCLRPTVEVHLGHHRGRLLSEEGYRPGAVVHHSGDVREPLAPGAFLARGKFLHEAEYLEARSGAASELEIFCEAASVHLLVDASRVEDAGDARPLLWLDGERAEPVSGGAARGVRLLHLVAGERTVWRHVRVRLPAGLRVYAFSFTAGCEPT